MAQLHQVEAAAGGKSLEEYYKDRADAAERLNKMGIPDKFKEFLTPMPEKEKPSTTRTWYLSTDVIMDPDVSDVVSMVKHPKYQDARAISDLGLELIKLRTGTGHDHGGTGVGFVQKGYYFNTHEKAREAMNIVDAINLRLDSPHAMLAELMEDPVDPKSPPYPIYGDKSAKFLGKAKLTKRQQEIADAEHKSWQTQLKEWSQKKKG
jgi:hypothetical protein